LVDAALVAAPLFAAELKVGAGAGGRSDAGFCAVLHPDARINKGSAAVAKWNLPSRIFLNEMQASQVVRIR
jgi:hypothetical protein